MSGEGATGQVYDAAGSVINIGDARGSLKLYNPSDIKTPEIPEINSEGDLIHFKPWLRVVTLSLSSAGMDVVLYDEAYDPTSDKHRGALAFIEPSNRSTYFDSLGRAVRAKMYFALLKSENALLQSVLDKDLSLPEMMKKLDITFGDNTTHSLSDILSVIVETTNLPTTYAEVVSFTQEFIKLICRYNKAGGNLSDLEALNILMIKLAKCSLDQLPTVLTILKTEKIKGPDYSLARFVDDLTSWASSEIDKPSNSYQSGTNYRSKLMAVGKGHSSGYGERYAGQKGRGRGRGRGGYNYNYNSRYHQDASKGTSAGRGKGSAGRGRA